MYADVAADVGDDVGHDAMMTSSLARLRPDPTDSDIDPTRSTVNGPTRSTVNGLTRSTTQQPEHALPRAATRADPSGGA